MSTSPPSPPPPQPDSSTALTNFIRTTLSYDTNVMLAAIISLLLVILFVLLLHLYTRWFLLQARHRSRPSITPRTVPSRLQRFTIIDTANSDHSIKSGLPFQLIASIPLFVFRMDTNHDHELDCAICLSLFEDEEIGRKLVECGHAFHVECIDMWLHSHSTCPICRGAIRMVQSDRTCKTDQVETKIGEIVDPGRNSRDTAGLTNNNEELNELEGLQVVNSTSSSSIGGLQSSRGCGSRSGGKVHPSLDVNGGELEG